MAKQMIIALGILLVMVGGGITELFVIQNNFDGLRDSLQQVYTLAQEEKLETYQFEEVWKEWKERREHIEFFLNHTDFLEINYRMAECQQYVANKDFDSAKAQIGVLIELTKHLPHQIVPTPEHVL